MDRRRNETESIRNEGCPGWWQNGGMLNIVDSGCLRVERGRTLGLSDGCVPRWRTCRAGGASRMGRRSVYYHKRPMKSPMPDGPTKLNQIKVNKGACRTATGRALRGTGVLPPWAQCQAARQKLESAGGDIAAQCPYHLPEGWKKQPITVINSQKQSKNMKTRSQEPGVRSQKVLADGHQRHGGGQGLGYQGPLAFVSLC